MLYWYLFLFIINIRVDLVVRIHPYLTVAGYWLYLKLIWNSILWVRFFYYRRWVLLLSQRSLLWFLIFSFLNRETERKRRSFFLFISLLWPTILYYGFCRGYSLLIESMLSQLLSCLKPSLSRGTFKLRIFLVCQCCFLLIDHTLNTKSVCHLPAFVDCLIVAELSPTCRSLSILGETTWINTLSHFFTLNTPKLIFNFP